MRWLIAAAIAALLALLVPSLAMADPATTTDPVAATGAAPPGGEATPADGTTTAPADGTTATPPATGDGTTAPAPPPATGDGVVTAPTPGAEATPTPAPAAGGGTTTTPTTPAPPAPPVVVPTPGSGLPALPDAPRVDAPKPDAAAGRLVVATTAVPPTAATPPSDAGLTPPVVPAHADHPAPPAGRPRVAAPAAAAPAPAPSVLQADGSFLQPYRDASAGAAAPAARHAVERAPVTFHGTAPSASSPFVEKIVPAGGAGFGGSSLLAVLASYVLPGSGTLPGSTLFLFLMQLGLLALVAFAPRSRGFERVVAIGLLRARAGHEMAVRRPG